MAVCQLMLDGCDDCTVASWPAASGTDGGSVMEAVCDVTGAAVARRGGVCAGGQTASFPVWDSGSDLAWEGLGRKNK